MNDSEIYVNVKFKDADSRSPSRALHELEPKENIGRRPYRLICLLCLVSSLIVTVGGLSFHVSQIRRSQITSNQKDKILLEDYNEMNGSHRQCRLQLDELNSTLQSNLSALNSKLSVLQRMHNNLRQQLTKMETKYRSVNETKAQICELLTSRREQACSQDWISYEDHYYFISTFERSYDAAKQHCFNSESKLLEINSTEEEDFVNNTVGDQGSSYWIGKCKDGEMASNVVYNVNSGKFECGECQSRNGTSCNDDQHRFICEKSAPLCPDVPEMIDVLCQEPPRSGYVQD